MFSQSLRALTLALVVLVAPSCVNPLPPAYAADAVLSWNANTESDLAGYKLYQGTISGQYGAPVDLGNVTTYSLTLPTLTVDQTYFWAITAYDKTGNESGKSNEVSKKILGVVPVPVPPPTILATLQGDPLTGPWAVEVTTNTPEPYTVEVWVNGVLDHTEHASPRCSWGDPGGPCTQVLKPAGTYALEFRVMKDGAQVASTTLTVVAADILAPAPPSGLMVQ